MTDTDTAAADETVTDDAEITDDAITDDADSDSIEDAESTDTADTDDAVGEPDAEVVAAHKRRWLRPTLWSITAVLIIALAALSVFFWVEHRASTQVAEARTAAISATRAGATAILTYRAGSVESDVAATQRLLTGDFADEYRELARTEVLPAAKERGLSSSVRISGVAVVTAGADTAETIVFVTQQVTAAAKTEDPTTTATAIRVGLVKQDGQWLISRFQPI